MRVEDDIPGRARAWRGLLIATLAATFAPAAAALVLQALARVAGCFPAQPAPCRLASVDLGLLLREVLNVAWALSSSSLFLALAACVGLTALHFGLRRSWTQVVLALFYPAGLALGAVALPILAVAAGHHRGCGLNEGASGPCIVYGHEMGMAYHAASIAQWLVFLYIPAGLLVGLLYAAPRAGLVLARGKRPRPGARPQG